MTTDPYVNLLYKKSQGAAFTNPLTSPLEEAIGSSAVKIQPSQIWNQEIPTSEPVLQAATALPEGITYGTKSIAVNYPWIIKYTSVWLSDTPSYQRSFYYKGTVGSNIIGTNILIGGIPYSQDSNGRTYMPKVYYSNDGGTTKIPINSKEWYFDGNSGYLTFLSSVTHTAVYIDFWRYTGTTGFSTSGTGPTGLAGLSGLIGFTGPTGESADNQAASSRGPTGPRGPVGVESAISFNITQTSSNIRNVVGNVTLKASTIEQFTLLPTSFQTSSNTNTWTNVTFLIVHPTTYATLYTLYTETFAATNLKTLTFSTSITNSTASDISGLLCFSNTLTTGSLNQLTRGYINMQVTQIPTVGYDYLCMHVVNTTTVKKVYNSSKTQVFTITPLSPANYGVINVWGTPKQFSQVSGVTLSYYNHGFKYIPASDGGMYISYHSDVVSNIYSGSTIAYTTVDNYLDSILVKYDRSGTALWRSRFYGSSTSSEIQPALCVDLNHNLYVGGYTTTADSLHLSYTDPKTTTYTLVATKTNTGFYWGYVAKFNSTGTYLGCSTITSTGTSGISIYSCCYSQVNDAVYCCGTVLGALTATAFNNQSITTFPMPSGQADGYICKLNNSTTAAPWCVRIGTSTTDIVNAIATDSAGHLIALVETVGTADIYVAGATDWVSVKQFTNGTSIIRYHIILKLNAAGQLVWATQITYLEMSVAYGTLTVSNDEVYVQFRTTSDITFKSTDNTTTTVTNAANRQFVAKYNQAGVYQWCINIIRGVSTAFFSTLTTAPSGNVYLEFTFAGIVTITDTSLVAVTYGTATSVGAMVLLVSSTGRATMITYHDVN